MCVLLVVNALASSVAGTWRRELSGTTSLPLDLVGRRRSLAGWALVIASRPDEGDLSVAAGGWDGAGGVAGASTEAALRPGGRPLLGGAAWSAAAAPV